MIPVAPRRRIGLDADVKSALFLLLAPVLGMPSLHAAAQVDFNREVRPILSQNCFKCHGVDDQTRKGGLRLDRRDAALEPAKSGAAAITPGQPSRSELVRRIRTSDADDLMPPPASKLALSDAQKATLERWVQEGAEYQTHWSFAAPRQPALPRVKHRPAGNHPIDRFVEARLEHEGLTLSPQADRVTLLRRVYLDLIGLPPTPEEADAFLNDRSRDAYERLIDRLLALPQYGERWARRWLDLARYADTNGYEKDRPRNVWPYRDWVIGALNADMPFDQFTIRQIAGDLLPKATQADRIATGFHRNTMLNEEGGIDPLEFRYYSMVDRINTTGTAWLGLTVGCAQCHSHKYDPIQQREYYQLLGLLNNADEPEIDVADPDVTAKRDAIARKVAKLTAELPDTFAVDSVHWTTAGGSVKTGSEARAEKQDDGSWRITGTSPDKDTYTLTFEAPAAGVDRLRLEAIADGDKGPGRTQHGNFVLTEIRVRVSPKDAPDKEQEVKLVRAEADVGQEGFPVERAIDGKPDTGWAVHVPGRTGGMGSHAATFHSESPIAEGNAVWTVILDHQFGGQHTLGHFRLSLGRPIADSQPIEVRRRQARDRAFEAWLGRESSRAARWQEIRPARVHSDQTRLRILEDGSVFADGDVTKRDSYDVKLTGLPKGVRAIRLEAMADDRLPKRGPGRVFFEGPLGDFFLSELTAQADGKLVKFASADQSYANGGSNARAAIDGDPQSGWSIDGAQGRTSVAIFRLGEPLGDVRELDLTMLFERYHPAPMGRFRIAISTDAPAEAVPWMPGVAAALSTAADQRNASQKEILWRAFLDQAPELAGARKEIDALRRSMPSPPTALVFAERPADHSRVTHRRHRGEFLSPKEEVAPGVPEFLPPIPKGSPTNRLGFARWLVSRDNPLTARVTVNRQWQAFFGRGLVRTMEDFGIQGELPSHPELLDWLAVDFMKQGWSMKRLHRLIVTSATYKQSSVVTPSLLERDPANLLLSRGPRHRLEAELVRDSALRSAGLLSAKMGGPSVFPPQPASITTEGTYGPLTWKVSEGEDRWRRTVYTFAKRTAPFAMLGTFDAPAGEACVARREASNTPLQALTLMNDPMFLEAAQALGRSLADRRGTTAERLVELYRRCLTRPPTAEEVAQLSQFSERQRARFASRELDPVKIAGSGEGDPIERATWTVLARVVLNLDEAVTQH
jgi:mono/diheme cytochrome c family protein